MFRVAKLATLAPLAVAVVLAGCGSSSSGSSGGSTAAAGSGGGGALTLSESEFKIIPASPSVAHTGTITITVKNTGAVTHALAVQTPSGTVKTSSIAPGGTATLTVNAAKAGSYTFYCPIPGHRQAGMQGTLVVGGGGASSSGAGSTSTPAKASGY